MEHIMWKRMACRLKKQDNKVDISELIRNDLTEDNDIRKLGKKLYERELEMQRLQKMQRQARGVKGLVDELKNEKMNVLTCYCVNVLVLGTSKTHEFTNLRINEF